MTKQVKSTGKVFKTPTRLDEQWTIPIPMRLQPDEADEFMAFVQERFSRLDDPDSDHIERIVRRDEVVNDGIEKRLKFRHVFRDSTSFGFFISNCALIARGENQGPLRVELFVDGTEERVTSLHYCQFPEETCAGVEYEEESIISSFRRVYLISWFLSVRCLLRFLPSQSSHLEDTLSGRLCPSF